MTDDKAPTYKELVAQVEMLQNRLDEADANYVRIRREPADAAPTALAGGEAVLTTSGLYFGLGGGVKSTALS